MLSMIRQSGCEKRSRIGLTELIGCLLFFFAAPLFAQAQQPPTVEEVAEGAAYERVAPTALAQFTTGIEDREPIDQITFVESDVSKVFFFSDLRGLTGKTVVHRWSFRGDAVAEVEFEVRGPRWRVWSSKQLKPEMAGDWTVEIVLPGDEVLAAETFTYSAAEG